uniref:Neurotransmitter-gated ion-channel ligand-binding domain-containing protein n=1 Tax=Romanomermis culicivorax TaxID=13658 RepID=A0A915IM34_ROMCU
DERQETISISGSLYLEWLDEHLTWNKEEYNGINRISASALSVWRPNLMVYNSHTELEIELFHEKPEVFLSFNETKSVVGGWTLESAATRLGYWNALNRQMSYTKPKQFKIEDLSLMNASSADVIMQHYFPFVELTPRMKRFSNYFSVTIKMPVVVSSLINIFAFLIPDFATKMTILIGNLLLQFCFMDDLMNILPYTTDSIPAI